MNKLYVCSSSKKQTYRRLKRECCYGRRSWVFVVRNVLRKKIKTEQQYNNNFIIEHRIIL